MSKKNNILLLIGLFIFYIALQYIPYGKLLLYPINLIVTFLHEFGHAFFAIITGGGVRSIEINADGSGLAMTAGGIQSIILMGGYIGSALFGNILLYTSIKWSDKASKNIIYLLGGLMISSALFLFSGIISSFLLILVWIGIIYLANIFAYWRAFLWFIGLASLAHIILDFRVGPSSDLSKFSDIFLIVPQFVWMYVWLAIVLSLVFYNLRFIFQKDT
jgi:hypothetical protein